MALFPMTFFPTDSSNYSGLFFWRFYFYYVFVQNTLFLITYLDGYSLYKLE